MNRFVIAALSVTTLGVAMAGSSAMAQNLVLPTSTVQPSIVAVAPVQAAITAPRLSEGRSAYDAPRHRHHSDQR